MLSKQAMERSNKLFEGYTIISAMISTKDRLVLITKNTGAKNADLKDDGELRTKFIFYNPNYHKDKHGIGAISWKQGIRNAWGAFLGDETQPTIFCDRDKFTIEFISDEKWMEDTGWTELPATPQIDFPMIRVLLGCTTIANEVYIFGLLRKLYKRIGQQQWQDLTNEAEHPNLHAELTKRKQQKKSLMSVPAGFSAVDGFRDDDIYACGDGGDLWHYDSKHWTRLDPPYNFDMETLLCAPDGYVYVAGTLGTIIKGRVTKENGETWVKLNSPTTEIIHSLAWFQGMIYIGVEYGLYTIDENGTVEEYQFPETGAHQYSFRNVASCDDALLSYGGNQALVFDGQQWEQIVGKMIIPIPEALSDLLSD